MERYAMDVRSFQRDALGSMDLQQEYIDEYFLAYGDSLSIDDMKRHCPSAILVDRVFIPDYKLAFRGPSNDHGYLTLVPCSQSIVPAALWKISVQDKETLDHYLEDSDVFEVHAMFVCGKICFTYLIKNIYPYRDPHPQYLECVKKGYKDMEFDMVYLKCAYE